MSDVVTPNDAQLCYDPWTLQQIVHSMQTIQGLFAIVMILMVGIFLFQIYIMKVRDNVQPWEEKAEHKSDEMESGAGDSMCNSTGDGVDRSSKRLR